MRSDPCLAACHSGGGVDDFFDRSYLIGDGRFLHLHPDPLPDLSHPTTLPRKHTRPNSDIRRDSVIDCAFFDQLCCTISLLPVPPGYAGRSYSINKPRKQHNANLHRAPLPQCLNRRPPPSQNPPRANQNLPRVIPPRCTSLRSRALRKSLTSS